MTTIPELIDREAAATVLRMEYNSDLKSEIKAAICNVLLQLPSKPLLHADRSAGDQINGRIMIINEKIIAEELLNQAKSITIKLADSQGTSIATAALVVASLAIAFDEASKRIASKESTLPPPQIDSEDTQQQT